jgi:ribosomal protein S25
VQPQAITAFSHDLDHRILHEVAAGRGVSQRSLARDLGVALGLTNLLLRRLARK